MPDQVKYIFHYWDISQNPMYCKYKSTVLYNHLINCLDYRINPIQPMYNWVLLKRNQKNKHNSDISSVDHDKHLSRKRKAASQSGEAVINSSTKIWDIVPYLDPSQIPLYIIARIGLRRGLGYRPLLYNPMLRRFYHMVLLENLKTART